MTDNPNNLDEQTEKDKLDFDVSDEIVVKDKDGSYKVLIGGQLKKFDGEKITDTEIPKQRIETKQPVLEEKLFDEEGLIPKEPVEDRLAPPAPAPWHKDSGAAFYFNTEDEEEVQKIATAKSISAAVDLGIYVEAVILESGLQLNDEAVKNKLKNVVLARLKHVREKPDTKSVLVRRVAEGGLGFSEGDADKLILLMEEKLKIIEAENKSKQPETELDKLIKQSEDIYDFSKKDEEEAEDLDKKVDYHEELADQLEEEKPELTKAPEISQLIEQPTIKPKEDLDIKKDTIGSSGVIRKTVSDSPRPKMEDVRQVSHLRSPIDELRYLGISELRRAGTNSLDNIKMIKEKVDALGEESFIKKVEGIKAWRQSPLYKLYVDIGRESMETGKSISRVIDIKTSAGTETLSLLEFEKITDLNKEMKY